MECLVKHKQINLNIGARQGKVMSNQSHMFFEEIKKWIDDGSPADKHGLQDDLPVGKFV